MLIHVQIVVHHRGGCSQIYKYRVGRQEIQLAPGVQYETPAVTLGKGALHDKCVTVIKANILGFKRVQNNGCPLGGILWWKGRFSRIEAKIKTFLSEVDRLEPSQPMTFFGDRQCPGQG